MEIFTNHPDHHHENGELPMKKEPIGHKRPMPPHERRSLMQISFDQNDMKLLNTVFGDEDEAAAAAQVLEDAPPEIKILAVQLMKLIEEVA